MPTPRFAATRASCARMVARFAAPRVLRPAAVTISSGSVVVVDGADEARKLFVEAHPYRSPVGAAELAVMVQDVFKLSLLRDTHPQARLVVLVADIDARDALLTRIPWDDHVEILVVEPD